MEEFKVLRMIKKVLAVIVISSIVIAVIAKTFNFSTVIQFYLLTLVCFTGPMLVIYLIINYIFKFIPVKNNIIISVKYIIISALVLIFIFYFKAYEDLKDIPYLIKSHYMYTEGMPQNAKSEKGKTDYTEDFTINGIDFSVDEPGIGLSPQ